jgi:UDP-2,3-diacylglucosamine hydrolase
VKVYFVSDAHLGSLLIADKRAHERKLVAWLDHIKKDATAIYMLGDMFDFWYEYRTVVPKGYVRFLGKLAEIVESGIEVHFFTGNHDIWTFGYLEQEIGLIVHRQPLNIQLGSKKFYLAHGDGLFVDEKSFSIIRKIFHNPSCQRLFRYVPAQWGQSFGFWWSMKNRQKILHVENKFQGEENEKLVVFAKQYFETSDVDYCVFGHRHIALDLKLKANKRVVILGDFVTIFSYGIFDGSEFQLEFFE